MILFIIILSTISLCILPPVLILTSVEYAKIKTSIDTEEDAKLVKQRIKQEKQLVDLIEHIWVDDIKYVHDFLFYHRIEQWIRCNAHKIPDRTKFDKQFRRYYTVYRNHYILKHKKFKRLVARSEEQQ